MKKGDVVEYDEYNVLFHYAMDLVLKKRQSLYLTGKAGTGKTTFLNRLRELSDKEMVVLAPTGVAAINAGGQTIHSFFNISFGPLLIDDQRYAPENIQKEFKYNKKKRELINSLDILVIDEISMVRADLLDIINVILKSFRSNSMEPFGGVQIVLIGDVFQLPPVVGNDELPLLRRHYKSPFFFSSYAFRELLPKSVELEKIYRQDDDRFIALLNAVRENQIDTSELAQLNARCNIQVKEGKQYITLATHNRTVDSINREKIEALKTPSFYYRADVSKDFPDKSAPTDTLLELKEGAQVMFIKNDPSGKGRFCNGTIGAVVSMTNDTIVVKTDDHEEIEVEKAEWENVRYDWSEKEKGIKKNVLGTFKQYPLKLAWAITVHKSQGLTFDYVIADLGQSFSEGQVYVALSRCTSLEGIVLMNEIPRRAIRTNEYALKFSKWMKMNIN